MTAEKNKNEKENQKGRREGKEWPPKDKMIHSDGEKKNTEVVKKEVTRYGNVTDR